METSAESPARPVARLSIPAAALVGVLALVAALAAGHLVAAFVGINASPYLAVGNSAIDLTPTPVKDFAVQTFGIYDKLVLLAGMAVVMLLVAVVAGVLSRRSPLPGTVAIVLLGVVAGIAVFSRPDLSAVALLAPAASLLAGVVAFRWLHTLGTRRSTPALGLTELGEDDESELPAERAPRGKPEPVPGRRGFLLGAGGVAVGAGVAGLGGQLVARTTSAASSRAEIGRLVPVRAAPPIPPGADFARAGTPTFLTPNPAFYRVDTALVVPQVRAEDWSLRIHGMVDRELSFSYDDIRDRPLVERTITMTCVSNEVGGPYISTANFLGVDLRHLLVEAGVRPGAEQLYSTSVDGYTAGTPIVTTMDPDREAMLAIGMNGEPLPLDHGFPARLVVPGLYGYVSATKWVTDLEVTTWAARKSYWLQRGWGQQAPIKTQSRIDTPKGFQTLPAGRVVIAGIAWAQTTGITKVEIRLGTGPWQEALLSTEVNEDTWRMWRVDLDLPPGNHQVACRATDDSGYTQTSDRVGTVPDGATGWHTISFTTR
ncbi:DMSO/TMAO reductase YedYZ, molybdopterin-dependent catalytic subunit [Amycolatopsis arida]|uniref:DMSO/TMAO reductase YedYZ, molybdopterin-dependent catalytic subunit n=1 Tax=Amycolatopsis arida TaxID=587909 RepID=A0A1I5ZDC4_9PSEU|nr:molybdopterin-dependent oxidoreductase [Amycolatopsis arida]TDX89544.1 DMSO/TMAO reductase YedYZ molybdopterin-dependent catalytic subunit [Amycolatopsis arida]SFQ54428.1 DMSO/TMAO reductase YedYZ, molybdopterin-dependent catalytic subunit [Amycolatopsis arida]